MVQSFEEADVIGNIFPIIQVSATCWLGRLGGGEVLIGYPARHRLKGLSDTQSELMYDVLARAKAYH